MSDDETLAANISYLAISKVGNAALNGLFLILTARALDASDYGYLSLVLTLLAAGRILSDFGVSQAVTRSVARANESINHIIGSAITVKIAGIFTAGIIFLGLAVLPTQGVYATSRGQMSILVAYLLVSIFGFGQTLEAVCRGWNRIEYEALGTLGNDLTKGILGIFALVYGMGLTIILSGLVIASSFRVAGPSIGLKESNSKIGRPSYRTANELVRFGVPLGLSSFAFLALISTDRLLIGYFLGADELGIYQVAFTVSTFVFIIPNVLKHASFPIGSAMDSDDSLFELLSLMVTIVVGPIAATIAINSLPVVLILFGAEYRAAAVPLSLLALGVFLRSISTPVYPILVGADSANVAYSAITVAAALLNLALNIVMILSFGVVGAAGATCLSFAFDGAGKLALYTKRYGMPLLEIRNTVSGGVVSTFWVGLSIIVFRQWIKRPSLVVEIGYLLFVTVGAVLLTGMTVIRMSRPRTVDRILHVISSLPLVNRLFQIRK